MAIAAPSFATGNFPSPLRSFSPVTASKLPCRIHLRCAISTTSIAAAARPVSASFSPNPKGRTCSLLPFAGGEDGVNGGNFHGRGSGDGGDENHDDGNGESNNNTKEALMALAEAGRSLESLPSDLKAAIEDGRIPGSIVRRYLELEKSGFLAWLLRFRGFKERLLADDLFLAKVAMECGVGIFTKTAAEYERRRENFFNELEIVFADVVMAIVADFMLVYLPAPTVSLRPAVAVNAGLLAKFFHNCPENAFQVALPGSSFSLLHRCGAIVRNGTKLFAVGTTSSLVGTVVTNALINARKAVDKSSAEEVENVPVLSTSVAYGFYMAVSSNLRYQVLAGVVEQRILEPLLHQHKLMLSTLCFAVRTGNTFLGSLLWEKYVRQLVSKRQMKLRPPRLMINFNFHERRFNGSLSLS